MTTELLTTFSNALADAVAAAAPSVVQVQGAGAPASGLISADDVVVTTVRALGREDGLHVRRHDGVTLDAELSGWDPATTLAILRVPGLGGAPIPPASAQPRVGHLVLAIGRSWSNNVSASVGLLAVIGGPLRTGRRHAIDRVLRTTAPMHEGFAGGALVDPTGALLGVVTSTRIRGTTVIVPGTIASNAVDTVLRHGRLKRGYLGVSGQSVGVPASQRADARETAFLVMAVLPGTPAAAAGLLVGDLIVALDGHPVESPEDLYDLMSGDRVGGEVQLRVVRGGASMEVPVTVGERLKP